MKLRKIIVLSAICFCLSASLVLSSASSRGQSIESQQWGPAVDGLQMSLSATDFRKGDGPELQLAFRNAGDHDVTLNLGSMLANGKVQLPDNIGLSFTDDQAKTRKFRFADKKHSFVAGRVDDYVVPLRVGSIYTLRLTMDQFWCHETREFEVKLLLGRNQLTAEFEGGGARLVNLDMPAIKLMNFWTGKVQSNILTIEK
jgi:hypothetical protein